jgi:hypothetical protein
MGCTPFMEYLEMHRDEVTGLLEKKASQSLDKITRSIVDMMPLSDTGDSFDNLLIVIRMEGAE